jgi:ribosomal protein S18 acetylase RimI-like enzyme
MPDVEIRPFSDEHLDAAAALLAERHERHLAAEPLLARGVDFRAQLAGQGGAGVVALRGGDLRAYLIGRTTEADAVVGLAGCAATEPELLRDLYAELATEWERDRQRVYVPASDAALVDVWFRLAFGLQFTYAVREASPIAAPAVDVTVRPGTADDLDAAVALERAFTDHLLSSPSFSARDPRTDEQERELWAGTWDDPAFTHFVAERDDRVIGHVLLYRREPGDLRIPVNSIDLSLVVTSPEARGSGVGSALTAHALRWAQEEGYTAVTIDWRVVNLLASRFFAARGFRPTFYRLYRHIP